MKDYYKILELNFGANIKEIKSSYRRLAFKYHPDVSKEINSSAKFIEITEAYEILSNEESKNQYDNIYFKFFKDSEKIYDENPQQNLTKEWENIGKKKAKEYSEMKFDKFAEMLIDELKLGISYTPNIIFILFCVAGVFTSLYLISQINFLIGLISLIIYSLLVYFLYDRAKKDYIAERKHKIINKYKQ